MFSSFNNIYNLIIKLTVISFGVIFTVLCCSLVYFFFDNLLWYIPFILFAVIVSILVGAYLFVVLTIPFKLPGKFDELKNKVALGEYSSIQEFQSEIAEFLVSFFNFFGANVIGGKFHLAKCEPKIIDCGIDFSSINKDSFKNNKTRLNNSKQAFHLPIKLGVHQLGYIILVTEGFTLPIFYSILKDFENYYLDDQIVHLLKG